MFFAPSGKAVQPDALEMCWKSETGPSIEADLVWARILSFAALEIDKTGINTPIAA